MSLSAKGIGMKRLEKLLKDRGLHHYGLIRPDVLGFGGALLEQALARGFYSEFAEKNPERRVSAETVLPGVESILVVLFPYALKKQATTGHRYGVASFSEGPDYHDRNRAFLTQAAASIGLSDAKHAVHVDTGPMIDRFLAYCAGLGWYGRNCLLMNREMGSAFTIGALFMTERFEEEAYVRRTLIDGCGDCRRCLEACPTRAIREGYLIDARRCLSECSQSKQEISYGIRREMTRTAYGCDVCQLVCPYNEKVEVSKGWDLYRDLEMTRREFEERFAGTALAWRGLSVYRRNLLFLLGNRFRGTGTGQAFEAARRWAGAPSPRVAEAAWWAMVQVAPMEGADWVARQKKRETDAERLLMMDNILEKFAREKR